MPYKPSEEARKLHHALIHRGFRAELEKFDGFKHIDIAVVKAMINIEVDGGHHNLKGEQALTDLKRTYHSFRKGYFTLRVPNSLIRDHFDETVEVIADILDESIDQLEDDY